MNTPENTPSAGSSRAAPNERESTRSAQIAGEVSATDSAPELHTGETVTTSSSQNEGATTSGSAPNQGETARSAGNEGEATSFVPNVGEISATDLAPEINGTGETTNSVLGVEGEFTRLAPSNAESFANNSAANQGESTAANGENLAPAGFPALRGARPRLTRKTRLERLRRLGFNVRIARILYLMADLGAIDRNSVVHLSQTQALRHVVGFLRRHLTQQRRDDSAAAGFRACMNRVLSQRNVLGDDLTRRLAHHLGSSDVLHRAPLGVNQQQHHAWSQHHQDANPAGPGLPPSGLSLPGRSSWAGGPSLGAPSTGVPHGDASSVLSTPNSVFVPGFPVIPSANPLLPRGPFPVPSNGANPLFPRDMPFPVPSGANPLQPGPIPGPSAGLIGFPHPLYPGSSTRGIPFVWQPRANQ